jgi:1-acyl-sn-glycerol-3-phosphate acyltransferase
MDHPLTPIVIVFAAWAAAVLLVRWLFNRLSHNGPGESWQDFLAWHVVRSFCRVVHRVRHEGLEHVPRTNKPGPLIVVSNHTGSIDPMLIQVGCLFNIRWMMATETMSPQLAWLWSWRRTIPVDRDGKDLAAAREAIRMVKAGEVVGVFPEGRIVTPPERIWPFAEGVGLIVSRTKAPVLLVWVRGTPATTNMTQSIFRRSRARVRFVTLVQFPEDAKPAEITRDLRQRLAAESGWPMTGGGDVATRPDQTGADAQPAVG